MFLYIDPIYRFSFFSRILFMPSGTFRSVIATSSLFRKVVSCLTTNGKSHEYATLRHGNFLNWHLSSPSLSLFLSFSLSLPFFLSLPYRVSPSFSRSLPIISFRPLFLVFIFVPAIAISTSLIYPALFCLSSMSLTNGLMLFFPILFRNNYKTT